jgi:hypothetical protein
MANNQPLRRSERKREKTSQDVEDFVVIAKKRNWDSLTNVGEDDKESTHEELKTPIPCDIFSLRGSS